MKYLFLAASMSLAVIGQFLLKRGVMVSLFSPFILLGLMVYAVSAISWLFVLQKFPLSVAYPALSLTYVAIVAISVLVFKEPLTTFKIIGVFFIIVGVYFLFKWKHSPSSSRFTMKKNLS